MIIPLLTGLAALADDYDGLILDLWGVVHDGSTAYPGVVDCLRHLRQRDKRVVLLSNSPRRTESLVRMLAAMGVARDLYLDLISSGEAVHDALLRRSDPWFAALGRRCLHVGPAHDRHLFDGLDLNRVEKIADADFLLATGPDSVDATLADYRPLLDQSAALGLPMVCANPDLVVIHAGRQMLCAGALAVYYQARGGDVRALGKPDPAIYAVCFARLGILDHRRILALGDAFHTDMAGAAIAGLDAVLCTGGIHAGELGTVYGRPPDPQLLAALAACYPDCPPRAEIAGLIW